MAKKELDNMQLEQPENKPGFFQKFFFWFLIPLLFCIALLLILAMFTNKNVFDYVDKLPFVSSNSETEADGGVTSNSEKLVTLQAEVQEKEVEVAQLQSQLESSTTEKQELEAEIENLQYEIEKLKASQDQATKEFKDIVATYEKMSAKKAAPILVQMSDDEALRILASLKPATLTAVLEKMEPEQAAKFTQLLTN
jgi:flagellar protein FlbB